MFGKNIKKIRGVKGLSQQSFADLFGLKRGTLAAYEEGRSNPRLETVIKIASHFNIEMDELLKTELTVNRLLQFNDRITTDTQNLPVQQFAIIPCVVDLLESDFVHQAGGPGICQKLPKLQLPLAESRGYIGYMVHSAEMMRVGGGGFLPKDVVIGKRIDSSNVEKLKSETPVLVMTKVQLLFRLAHVTQEGLHLETAAEGLEPILIPFAEIVQAWEVCHVFHWKLPALNDSLEMRLIELERRIGGMRGG
jgi:transcriptional regulator with XRE-family HTH domain